MTNKIKSLSRFFTNRSIGAVLDLSEQTVGATLNGKGSLRSAPTQRDTDLPLLPFSEAIRLRLSHWNKLGILAQRDVVNYAQRLVSQSQLSQGEREAAVQQLLSEWQNKHQRAARGRIDAMEEATMTQNTIEQLGPHDHPSPILTPEQVTEAQRQADEREAKRPKFIPTVIVEKPTPVTQVESYIVGN